MKDLSIPKIDLHCHLDGSVRPETLHQLLRQRTVSIPTESVEQLLPIIQVPDDCPSLSDYLQRFRYPVRVMQSEETISQIAEEFLEDCQADGLSYVEVRFAPIFHTAGGLSVEQVIESLLTGLNKGHASTGIPFGVILCVLRQHSPDETLEQIKKGIPYLHRGVVAVDLAGDEENYPPQLHRKAFELASQAGFKVTIHAGETGKWENIYNSIEILKADRIGHGLAAAKSPELMDLLRRRQIPLEMCPTSNIQTKGVARMSEHPILRHLRSGLAVTLNTDNRTVSDVTITSEMNALRTELHATDDDLIQMARNSIQAAFVSDELRQRLLKQLPEPNGEL